MLSITKYLKTLLPHIEKDQILEDLRITETELQNIVLPAYADAAGFFSKDKFKSKENLSIDSQIRSILKSTSMGRLPTFINEFSARLVMIEANIGILIKIVDQEIGRDVVTDGVSSKKVVLMRITEKMSYISRYSLDLLNLVYMNEASELGVDVGEIKMSPAEIAKAKGAIGNLARLLQSYGIDAKQFEKELLNAPDLILSKGDNQDLESMYSDTELDPMSSPLLQGFTGNPIYHIRMVVAEWQSKRYKVSQDKKKVLELRLLHLNLLKDKQGTNPRLEQEIAYNQSRVAKLDRYLVEVEQDLGIAA